MTDLTQGPKEPGESAEFAQAMPAEFGLSTATFVVIAGMVGAGVLTTSGYTVALVGSNQWMLILWVLGGVTAVCGALTLAELSAALPRTGGDYVYLYEAYGPLPAFLSGWVSFLIGFAGPSAASAFAFAKYTLGAFPQTTPHSVERERILASAAILLFAAIHVSGRRKTARVQAWITILKLVGLGAFALSGLSIGWHNSANLNDRTPLSGTMAVTLMSSMVYIYYAYTGWNSASYLAGEVKDAQRRLPQAILLGTAGVTVLYLALNVVYALALSAADIRGLVPDPRDFEQLRAVDNIAQLAATRLFGARWSAWVSLAIGLMLLSTLSVYVLIGPRGHRPWRPRCRSVSRLFFCGRARRKASSSTRESVCRSFRCSR
jgi:APA family basic amino acid/polyamine antiporter